MRTGKESNRKCLKLKKLKIAVLFRSTDINYRRDRWEILKHGYMPVGIIQ